MSGKFDKRDKVIIVANDSCFFNKTGFVVELKDRKDFPIMVLFEDTLDVLPFDEDELELLKD